jgi:hypothetical protein
MRTGLPRAVFTLLILALASCGDAGVATIRIQLNSDQKTGTVTTSSLLVSEQPGPIENQTTGVTWTDRTNLSCSGGTFASFDGLKISDIEFKQSGQLVRVTLPRGKDAKWPAAFTPVKADRAKVGKTFDPRDQLANATTHLSIEIDFTQTVVSSDVDPPARGLTADKPRDRRATLIIPVDRAVGEGEPFTWHVSLK